MCCQINMLYKIKSFKNVNKPFLCTISSIKICIINVSKNYNLFTVCSLYFVECYFLLFAQIIMISINLNLFAHVKQFVIASVDPGKQIW